MQQYQKPIKRQIRELADLLYERKLNVELTNLDAHFDAWRKGELSPFDLAAHIHQFHQKPARELFNLFSQNNFLDMVVARGIVENILKTNEIPPEAMQALADKIAFIKNED